MSDKTLAEEVPQDQLKYVGDRFRKAANRNDLSQEIIDEFMEEAMSCLRDRDYPGLLEEVNSYDMGLAEIKSFLGSMMDDNVISKEEEDGYYEIDEGTKIAIKDKLSQLDTNNAIQYIDEPVPFDTFKALSSNLFADKGQKVFFISNKVELEGRISVALTQNRKQFELMNVRKDKKDQLYFSHFDEPNRNTKVELETRFTHGFFVYKFVSDYDEYLVFSTEKLDTMRCRIQGMPVSIADAKQVGEEKKLPIDQDVLFVYDVKPAISPLSDEEMKGLQDKVNDEYFAEHLLGQFRHPRWFEQMVTAQLLTKEDYEFPSGLIWLAEAGTGKSKFLQALNRSLDEPYEVHTGTGGTIKGLIPSFSEKPPNEGYLLNTQRIACVDEFLEILNSIRHREESKKDAFRPLLDLVEHSRRTFGSGNGSITGKMESILISASNPSHGISNMMEAVEELDVAFLSRFILYQQLESHVGYIDERKPKLKNIIMSGGDPYPDTDDEFLSLIDTLRNEVVLTVDFQKIDEIQKELRDLVPSGMMRLYKARYDNHMANLTAGLAKMNYFIKDRERMEVTKDDYKHMKHIMETVISSWSEEADIENMSHKSAVNALPQDEKAVYDYISDNETCLETRLKTKFGEAVGYELGKLEKYGLIEKQDDSYVPWWSGKFNQVK